MLSIILNYIFGYYIINNQWKIPSLRSSYELIYEFIMNDKVKYFHWWKLCLWGALKKMYCSTEKWNYSITQNILDNPSSVLILHSWEWTSCSKYIVIMGICFLCGALPCILRHIFPLLKHLIHTIKLLSGLFNRSFILHWLFLRN